LNDMGFLTTELKPSPEYEIISSDVIYVGEVESDDFESVTYKIHASDADDDNVLTLRLFLKYKDDYNNEFTSEEEVKVQLFSDEEAKKYGLVPRTSYTGTVILLLIIIGGVVYYIYRRRKKKLANGSK